MKNIVELNECLKCKNFEKNLEFNVVCTKDQFVKKIVMLGNVFVLCSENTEEKI